MKSTIRRTVVPVAIGGGLLLSLVSGSVATSGGPQERCLTGTYSTSGMAHLAAVRAQVPPSAGSIVDVTTGTLPLPDHGQTRLCDGVEGTVVEFESGAKVLLPEGAERVRVEGDYVVAEFDVPDGFE